MIRNFITLLTLAVFVWLVWSFSGRNTPLEEPTAYISVIEEINPSENLSRNILGVQPYMEVSDYFNRVIFKEKLRKYLVISSTQELIRKNTLIVFPESIGTYLFLLNEKHNLTKKRHLHTVLRSIAFSNAFDFFLGFIKTGDEPNKEFSSIIRMKAKVMAAAYFETFSELAIETNSYILAGSIVLPEPKVANGEIVVNLKGPLYDASFLFGPDGKVVGTPILKSFSNSFESSYLSSPESPNKTFNLPYTKTRVMIGYDSWFDKTYQGASKDAVEVFLNPTSLRDHSLLSKWKGYEGTEKPGDLNDNDIQNFSNLDAWHKYGPYSRIKATDSKIALSLFFRGKLWDLDNSGNPIAVYQDRVLPITPAGKGGIWSLNY